MILRPFHCYTPVSKRQYEAAIDRLAELLAQGCDLASASDRMGVTRGTGTVLLCDLSHRYGEEARA